MAGPDISSVLSFLLLSSASLLLVTSQDSTIQQKCSQEFLKVTSCLDYATAKAAAPSSSCCSAVADIRNSDPACLCFIIQQTHSGSADTKNLGIQFDRLLQLPDTCKLANASVSNCPKLLKLSPSSPDYAIFTNATTKAATSSSSGTTATVPTSSGFVHNNVYLLGNIAIALVSAILFSILSMEA